MAVMAAAKHAWGATLKKLRESRGLTQETAAELLKVPLDTYQNWEQGRSAPADYFCRLVEKAIRAHKK
jgi:DNA-binding transcriptional regulator YiaG